MPKTITPNEIQPLPPVEDLPAKLAQPARRALRQAGIMRLEQLPTFTETELLQLHGMGPKALEQLRAALTARGQAFAKP